MHNDVIYELAADNPDMTDIDRLVNLYWGLSLSILSGVPGDVVELGCNRGKTSVFFGMLLRHYGSSAELHLYDSFQGLPAPCQHDAYLHEGELVADVAEVEDNFRKWQLAPPRLHPGWFQETLPSALPDQIAFAYVDVDFYDSTKICLESIYPRLAPNAVVMIDDYCDSQVNRNAWPGLPGVKLACDHFFALRPERLSVLVGGGDLAMAYMRKH